MAAIFCLFSVALCELTSRDATNSLSNSFRDDSSDHTGIGLSAQLVSVPRVYLSPCPRIFRYTFNGKEWFGLAVISKPAPKGVPSRLKVLLSLGFHYSSRYVGEISLAKDKRSTVEDISNGKPILYQIRFPTQNPIPKLTAIYYNDQLICTGPAQIGQFVTTITLDHTLYTGLSNPPIRPYVEPQTWPPRTTRQPIPYTTRRATTPDYAPAQPPMPSQNYQSNDRFNDLECGVPEYTSPQVTALIIGGNDVHRAQFPWMAAYHHYGRVKSGLICGGSLISTKIVITAAHCVQGKGDTEKKKAEEAIIHLGRYNLDASSESNIIQSAVTELIIHPEWNVNDERYDADIALAVLFRTIEFTKFVKPICLWTATTSYDDLVGKSGIIAGWGKTELSAVSTNKPLWNELPVVDEGTCLRSNDVFSKLTSSRTFCAGDRSGTKGPCNGDSGGGFVTRDNGKWYLRGMVSSSLLDRVQSTCDTHNYAVFTDVTKFNSWIQTYMSRHG